MKGLGLALVVGIGALMMSGGNGEPRPPQPKPEPKPGPDEGFLSEEMAMKLFVDALATNDPATMRGAAVELRLGGWLEQAEDLEYAAQELEEAARDSKPRNLSEGMKGDDVKAWQLQLIKDGYDITADGAFGPVTKSSTVAWQVERGIKGDGIVGPATREKIGTKPTVAKPVVTPPVAIPATTAPRNLSEGMKGDDVKAWQSQLIKDGYAAVKADSVFGPVTKTSTVAWQVERGIKGDGIVGPATRDKIGTKPTVKPVAAPVVKPVAAPVVKPVAAPVVRNLSEGMKGDDVKAWQSQLIKDGYAAVKADSVFGPVTKTSTVAWQVERGIKGDGIVGPATRDKIGTKPTVKPVAAPVVKPVAAPVPVVRNLSEGMKGADVTAWQSQLIKDGYSKVKADSIFGAITKSSTVSWQVERGIKGDGIVGPTTRSKIGTKPTVKAPAAIAAAPPKPPAVAPKSPTAKPVATPVATAPRLLKVGLTGTDVQAWQAQLIKDGYVVKADSIFGPATEAATKSWQADRGLKADGIVGPDTRSKIGTKATKSTAEVVPPLTVDPSKWRTLKRGTAGADVTEWQLVLLRGGYNVASDGKFGPETEAATKAWQTAHGLVPDGIVGPNTRSKIEGLTPTSIVSGELSPVSMSSISGPPPFPMTEEPSLAEHLAEHLKSCSLGQEDRELVATFQRSIGLNDTGNYGPATAEALISFGIVPPRPFYWPTKKLMRAKTRYRLALREQARRDPLRAIEWTSAANV